MRLEHFHYIVEIARCKSMSKASKKLYITQPSLSTAIQNLEDELGFQIFKRSASGVALTDKGEQLLEIAENIVNQLERVKELADPDTDTMVHLNLAAVPVFCNALMIEADPIAQKKYSHCQLEYFGAASMQNSSRTHFRQRRFGNRHLFAQHQRANFSGSCQKQYHHKACI